MSAYFVISAYDPQASIDDPIDASSLANQLQINLFDYRQALIQTWPAISFNPQPEWALEWMLEPAGMRGRLWHAGHSLELQVAGSLTAAFIAWHRKYIDLRYPLYLFRPPQRVCLELVGSTSLTTIQIWLDQSLAHYRHGA